MTTVNRLRGFFNYFEWGYRTKNVTDLLIIQTVKSRVPDKHSSLNLPLKDSTYELSVGVPDLEKSIVT